MKPTNHPIGIDHHIPASPNSRERSQALGIRIIHNDIKDINIGISVSPAPRITPEIENIAENIT